MLAREGDLRLQHVGRIQLRRHASQLAAVLER
jgi:hypothetical protein